MSTPTSTATALVSTHAHGLSRSNAKYLTDAIERAISQAVAEERERCAGIGDEHAAVLRGNFDQSCARAVEGVAAAIRKGTQ